MAFRFNYYIKAMKCLRAVAHFGKGIVIVGYYFQEHWLMDRSFVHGTALASTVAVATSKTIQAWIACPSTRFDIFKLLPNYLFTATDD